MDSNYSIALNFLPLTIQEFSFTVYRKLYAGEKREGGYQNLYRNSLPINPLLGINDKKNRAEYWISFTPCQDFKKFTCQHSYNHKLTQYFIFSELQNKLTRILNKSDYILADNQFRKTVYLIIKNHSEGEETISIEPYYLNYAKKFGFIIEFKFVKKPELVYSKKIQKLSLSLDANFKSNKNFYIDKYNKIEAFIKREDFIGKLFPLFLDTGISIDIERSLYHSPSGVLKTKKYLFAGDKEEKSQFMGLKKLGPLETVEKSIYFYFAFREEDRDFAVDLYRSLQGKAYPNTFSGMNAIFKFNLEKNNTSRNLTQGFSWQELEENIKKFKELDDKLIVQIIIIPSEKDGEYKNVYAQAKYLFAKANIPLQFITVDLLKNKENFKWSIANIGLQIFAKLGGKPWKVKPSNDKCLIIGVGQSHEKVQQKEGILVKKYFAYSVLTDSSG